MAKPTFATRFAYNGDGVRVGKTIGGATTDYLVDLAATLPVVISDTDAVYLYALGNSGKSWLTSCRLDWAACASQPRG